MSETGSKLTKNGEQSVQRSTSKPHVGNNATAISGGINVGPVKKSSFQITSVTATRMSADGGDDSADDLDESHTDELTPSFSEDTFSKDDVFFNPPSSLGSAPVIPTSSQYGLAIVADGHHQEDHNNTPAVVNNIIKPESDREVRNERFKVVKIETTEPFKRGRWQCMDYLDHSTDHHEHENHIGGNHQQPQQHQQQQPLPVNTEAVPSVPISVPKPVQSMSHTTVPSNAAAVPPPQQQQPQSMPHQQIQQVITQQVQPSPSQQQQQPQQTQQQPPQQQPQQVPVPQIVPIQQPIPQQQPPTQPLTTIPVQNQPIPNLPPQPAPQQPPPQQPQQPPLANITVSNPPPQQLVNIPNQQNPNLAVQTPPQMFQPQMQPQFYAPLNHHVPTTAPQMMTMPTHHPHPMQQYPQMSMTQNYPPQNYVQTMPPPQMLYQNYQQPQQMNTTGSPSFTGGYGGAGTGQPASLPAAYTAQGMAAYPQVMVPQMVQQPQQTPQQLPPVQAAQPPPQQQQQQPIPVAQPLQQEAASELQVSAALLESLVEVTAGNEGAVVNAEDAESASGTSAVAIDNKIEQAMDLVKSHLMFAVREEVEVLREKIAELMERISFLEMENAILKSHATQEALAQVASQTAAKSAQSSAAAAAAVNPQ